MSKDFLYTLLDSMSVSGHEIPLQKKVIAEMTPHCDKIITDYTGIGKIQYIAGEKGLPILSSEYTDRVTLQLLIPADQVQAVEKAVTEGTSGRAKMKKEKDLYYAVIDGEVKVFDD